jgi:RHS repeat-associated protein
LLRRVGSRQGRGASERGAVGGVTTDDQVVSRDQPRPGSPSHVRPRRDEEAQRLRLELPTISLPKGGGAIRGIDEKFAINPSNGTLSLSVPLPFTPSREEFVPPVTLRYDSGAGNGVVGLGWTLDLPSIRRRTDRQIPQYRDEDVFVLTGGEDLVPAATWDGTDWAPDVRLVGELTVTRFRPRVDSDFARIERIEDPAAGTWWRVTSRADVTTFFGVGDAFRIRDPAAPDRVFAWLPSISFDDRGNCIVYEHKEEDLAAVSPTASEASRYVGTARFTNRYPKRVHYGNREPCFADEADPYRPPTPTGGFLFEAVFDYGEHDAAAPTPDESPGVAWPARQDAFSSYRSGFEIRTYRLLRRVLMFHRFDELNAGEPCLVRSLDLGYASVGEDSNAPAEVTYLVTATQSGYARRPDGSYSKRSLPPLELTYEPLRWSSEVRRVDRASVANLPGGVSGGHQWVDLFSEGIPGVLVEEGSAWYYKANLGDVDEVGAARLDAVRLVAPKPSFEGLQAGALQLHDLEADGQKQIVVRTPDLQGYFALEGREWAPFRTQPATIRIDLSDRQLRMIDLVGDGRADLLVSEEDAFVWYRSRGKQGYDSMQRTPKVSDEERGPVPVFADDRQSVFLADMSGDGLTDIVRIRNREISYWPNLGYGRFGARVAMDNPPAFDHPDHFDPRRLRLADVSGTGASDVLYFGRGTCIAWLNLSGNGWSDPQTVTESLPAPEPIDVSTVDLLGNGTTCIVWSSSLPADADAPLRYVDVMGGVKPHLLRTYANNLGKEVELTNKSSTWFYLRDKLEGRPWLTQVPFPVQCVRRVTTRDRIAGSSLVTEYRYHHGCYDHAEREFRGFGMVEQVDAEDFEHWAAGADGELVDRTLHQTPTLTKTWFHTGTSDEQTILERFRDEYWDRQLTAQGFPVVADEPDLPDARLAVAPGADPGLLSPPRPWHHGEAARACRGMILRREAFALDAPTTGATPDELQLQATPYTVTAHDCLVEFLQPPLAGRYAATTVKESEAIAWRYEREIEDPRVEHTLNTVVDEYGDVLETATVTYARRTADASLPQPARDAQGHQWVKYARTEFTKDAADAAHYRLRQPSRHTEYEILGLPKAGPLYALGDFVSPTFAVLTDSDEIPYHELDAAPPPGTVLRRMLRAKETRFYDADAANALPLHELHFRALPYESRELAYSAALLDHVFGARASPAIMAEGGYVLGDDGGWWVPSGRWHYLRDGEAPAAAHSRFFARVGQTDSFGALTAIDYFGPYFLMRDETLDAAGERTQATDFDLRTLSPRRLVDANDNVAEVLLDELGWVKATALHGKGAEADDLTGLTTWSTPAEEAAAEALFDAATSDDVAAQAALLLGHATVRHAYDLDRYRASGGKAPPVVATVVREQHFTVDGSSPVQASFEYSNGFGKIELTKFQAEPGVATRVTLNDDGTVSIDEVDTSTLVPPQLRWLGTGRKIANNKGNVVKDYEPFFSVTHAFESEKVLVEAGVTQIRAYDALDRVVRVDYPDATLSRTEHGAWKTTELDQNDTILESEWHARRVGREIDAELIAAGKDPAREEQAARQTEAHSATPLVVHLDAFGRPIYEVADDGVDELGQTRLYGTLYRRDISGHQLSVTDPRGNVTISYQHDMRGALASYDSADDGARWMLENVADDPLRTWDERDHTFVFSYDDPLHRPTTKRVVGGDAAQPLDHVFERLVYGADAIKNLRTRVAVRYDTAGKVANLAFDFKGNLLSSSRRFAKDYRSVPDWSGADPDSLLEAESFDSTGVYDALNRVTERTTPDGSVYRPTYNRANLLETVAVTQDGTTETLVTNVDYDARGSRSLVAFGNGVVTTFVYDRETFRLLRLTARSGGGQALQDLHYTYDPVGNATHMVDACIPTVWFDNAMVSGESTYTYEPLYRLGEANGREHSGQTAFGAGDNTADLGARQQCAPGDLLAWRNYTERFRYDEAGNIEHTEHVAGTTGSWTRDYTYEAGSNRIVSTQVGADAYAYAHHPQHGFLTTMPHLSLMRWTFRDEFQAVATQVVHDGVPETTWYVYDGEGKRVRKVTDRAAAANEEPSAKSQRYYLEGVEIQRDYGAGGGPTDELRTLHVMTDHERVALLETRVDTAAGTTSRLVRYQGIDQLGSSHLETDDAGRVISYEEYHPFGTTAYQAVDKTVAAAAKRYRYTGLERDDESGFAYHAARYYAPWLGRWISADKHADELDGNRYAYVKNNPIVHRDRNGLYEEPVHGLLTYRLALAAGWTPTDAARIAIATAGMDHDAATRPGDGIFDMMGQIWRGRTQQYHYPTQATALAAVKSDIKGRVRDIEAFSRHLHSLEDVGFKDAPGPHDRSQRRDTIKDITAVGVWSVALGLMLGSTALGVKSTAASVGLGIAAGLFLALGLYAIAFAIRASGTGHPYYKTERGEQSDWTKHIADEAFQDPKANTREMLRVYKLLKEGAAAHYRTRRRTDDRAAKRAIQDVVTAADACRINNLVNQPLRDTLGHPVPSYADIVRKRGRWAPKELDVSLDRNREWIYRPGIQPCPAR